MFVLIKSFLLLIPALLFLSGCSSFGGPSANSLLIGSPQTHGFVVIEGETSLRGVEIQSVTLENTQHPEILIHGKTRGNATWISNLEPGEYRINRIRLVGEASEFTKTISGDEIADDPKLTFNIKEGELFYLGLIEIFMTDFKTKRNRFGQIVRASNYVRSNIVDNHDQFRVWETLYDEYSSTPWEPVLLKKLDEQKITHPKALQ